MYIIIFQTLVAVMALIGLTQVIYWIRDWIIRPADANGAVWIVPVKGKVENIEQLIRFYSLKLNYSGSAGADRIVMLDMGAEEETLEICRHIIRQYNSVILCKPDQLGILLRA